MKCPGQDTQYWKPGAIFDVNCPKCGRLVEFFKDDTTRKCGGCGHRFMNPEMDFGCASYCQFAEQCIGNLPPELLAQKEDLLKDRVALAMKRRFKTDFARIGHATRVARYAERIGRKEGANLAVVLSAAYLNDIGRCQPQEEDLRRENLAGQSETVARRILEELGAQPALIDAVCRIVGQHQSPRAEAGPEFKAVYDAGQIVKWESAHKKEALSTDELDARIQTELLTSSGRDEARSVLLEAWKN